MNHLFLNIKTKILLLFALWLTVCPLVLAQHKPNIQNKTIVLNYDDFGPQVLAYQLIGYEFYQWDNSSSGNPNEKPEIFVVVYRNIPLKKVKSLYPVIKNKSDFRYLEYNKAIKFLDSKINELEKMKSDGKEFIPIYEKIIAKYKQTKAKIVGADPHVCPSFL